MQTVILYQKRKLSLGKLAEFLGKEKINLD